MQVLAFSGLTAMADGVCLPKTGFLAFLGCVEGRDVDAVFQGIQGFGETF